MVTPNGSTMRFKRFVGEHINIPLQSSSDWLRKEALRRTGLEYLQKEKEYFESMEKNMCKEEEEKENRAYYALLTVEGDKKEVVHNLGEQDCYGRRSKVYDYAIAEEFAKGVVRGEVYIIKVMAQVKKNVNRFV